MGSPDFGLDFLLFQKGVHLYMKKCRFLAVCERVHRYRVGGASLQG